MNTAQIPFSIPSISFYNSFVHSPMKDGRTCAILPAVPSAVKIQRPDGRLESNLSRLCKEFSFESLCKATQGFLESNIIGKGSFGSVFRGRLDDQTEVAVKVLKNPEIAGFTNEVEIMSKFRHPNLVILLGFARNGDERLLVYEQMEDADCEKRLKTPSLRAHFPWNIRLSVLADCCRGLAFMVNSSPIAFHRDIKPSNMMIDKHGVGKLTDFGLACELPSRTDTTIKVNNAAGTIGYACPDYIKSGVVSEATEVYSFGVCILEFLTNQPPAVINPKSPNQVVYLLDTLQGHIPSILAIVDKKAGWPDNIACELGRIVYWCCDPTAGNRPKFIDIAKILHDLLENLNNRVEKQMKSENSHSKAPLISMNPLSPLMPTQQTQQAAATSRIEEKNKYTRGIPQAFFAVSTSHEGNINPVIMPLDFSVSSECIIGRNMNELITLPEKYRLCISRAHFSVRRSEPDKFMIVNLSGNGTLIEGTHFATGKVFLRSKGDSCDLCDQDCVKLCSNTHVPFLELRFISGKRIHNEELL